MIKVVERDIIALDDGCKISWKKKAERSVARAGSSNYFRQF
jgi:hypothetical protein